MAKKKVKTKRAPADDLADIRSRLRKKAAKSGWKKKTTFTSWGFTRYNDHKQCPLKAKLKHLDKIEEPPSEPMRRGSVIGKLGEIYVKGKVALEPKDKLDFVAHYGEPTAFVDRLLAAVASGKLFPDELLKFEKTFKEMRALYKKSPQRMVVEENWAMKKDWTLTQWNNWDECWLRVKIDCGNLTSPTTMVIRDWKTGKFRAEKVEEYVEQLELYVLSAFSLNAQLETVEAYLCFLDPGIMYPEPETEEAERLTFTRADVPRLKKLWDKRTRAMLLAKSFPPRPNDKCQWCHYRKANAAMMPGGKAQCKF